jgi:acylphosphatase
MTRRVRLLIEGQVQGVGYRYFAARAARGLGIRGWVRNLPDRRVEALAEGDARAVAAFVERLREGPGQGRVDRIELLEPDEAEGEGKEEDFEIRL